MLSDPEFFECELLTVSREQAELAASEVSGCEACSESAEIHFNNAGNRRFGRPDDSTGSDSLSLVD
jgi:hypothetical protein